MARRTRPEIDPDLALAWVETMHQFVPTVEHAAAEVVVVIGLGSVEGVESGGVCVGASAWLGERRERLEVAETAVPGAHAIAGWSAGWRSAMWKLP